MKVVTSDGVILESSNKLVIEQWKKQGLKEVPAVATIKEKKTGKQNTVALNQAVTDTMSLLFSSQPAAPCENGYIFVSRNGNNCPLSRYQAYRIIREAASNLGMQQHISCHSLRKTFGYYAWKQGTAPAMLMTIFNHSSYQITKRYLGIEQDDKDKVFLNISL